MGVNVRIEIDGLVLHGVPRGDRYRVAVAFERELTRLLHAAEPVMERPDPRGSVRSTLPRLVGPASPRQLGTALARAVHATLTDAPHAAPPGTGRVP